MNSLYGRFGMNPLIESNLFINKSDFFNLCEQFEITDFIDLDDLGYFVTYINPELIGKLSKTSIGIASAVTSYGRVVMSFFKKNPLFKLFYTDTDSVFVDKPLPDSLVNSKLGNFKLEYIFKKGIFLGPKIYCTKGEGITTAEKYICKVKGFKDPKTIPYKDLESLLEKNKYLDLMHSKWFRKLGLGRIDIKSQIYKLKSTENKRELIYKNGIAVNTKPIKLNK
jgi:hypothetical protein